MQLRVYLLAPKSGRELRADISERADELIKVARDEYEKGLEKGKRIYSSAKEQAEEIQGKIEDLTDKGSEKMAVDEQLVQTGS